MDIKLKNGFHYGAGESILGGWTEWWQSQNNAGIPVSAIGADNAGPIYEIQEGGFVGNTLVWRRSLMDGSFDPNSPRYESNPETEAERMLVYKYENLWPPELDKTAVWLKNCNEIRTQSNPGDVWYNNLHPGEWWGRYALRAAMYATENNVRVILLSPSSGDYDYGFWEQPSMLEFLRYAIANPHNAMIGLHEYSYVANNLFATVPDDNATVDDVIDMPTVDYWKLKIGRFRILLNVCDRHELGGWPMLFFSEWGWALNDMPAQGEAMSQIEEAAVKIYGGYYNYIRGNGTWYLSVSNKFGRTIAQKTNALLLPSASIAINEVWSVEEKTPNSTPTSPIPPIEPPLPEENMIKNWSFEGGWQDVPAGVGNLINQQPNDWNLYWHSIGDPLWAVNQKTGRFPVCATIPECLHKLNEQLPPPEQVDGETPLILDGLTCYKVFARGGPWGAVLTPSLVDGLLPNKAVRVSVPVQVHYQSPVNNDSPDDVEIWLTAGTNEGRVQHEFYALPDLPDRQWVTLEIEAETDTDGRLPVGIRIQTKWANNRDVFLDAITAVYVEDPVDPPINPPAGDCKGLPRVQYRRVVHVYPAEATPARAVEIAAYALEHGRETAGGSYDDAGLGDLDSKTAVLWDIRTSRMSEFVEWYAVHYPGTAVEFMEPIDDTSPPTSGITTWPCGEFKVTQWFGRNPDNYPLWDGGHEGIDLVCPIGSPYYAAGDGIVTKVSDRRANGSLSAYGWHVIVDHGDGLTTLYAHAHPSPPVAVGQRVMAGDVVALSGNTGNSSGPHLHFTVKQAGEQTAGYPAGYVDPCGYLEPVARYWLAENGESGWLWKTSIDMQNDTYGRCVGSLNLRDEPSADGVLLGVTNSLSIVMAFGEDEENGYVPSIAVVGEQSPPDPPTGGYEYNGRPVTYTPAIHAPADDWRWPVVDDMIAELEIPVKFMSNGTSADFYGRYSGRPFSLIRLMHNFSTYISPTELYNDGWRGEIGRFYAQGARDFELHNEPNLPNEGLGVMWADGAEFGAYMREVAQMIRADYPEARLWFPGMSPGVPWTNQFPFTQAAWAVLEPYCYGFCMHAYTGNNSDAVTAVGEIVNQVLDLQEYMGLQVPLVVSECSVNRGTDYSQKAAVYQGIDAALMNVSGVQAIVYYISDWFSPPPEQAGHGESWYGTPMADLYKNG